MFRRMENGQVEVLLVHPGGPFFRNKDLGVWSIPKGEIAVDEKPLAAARREFNEETSVHLTGPWLELGYVVQKGGKKVFAWACEGNCVPEKIVSNFFPMEWPPRSGLVELFPEADRAEFFNLSTAREKINPAQAVFLDRLEELLKEQSQ